MSVDYKPDYTSREAYYANKDRAVAARMEASSKKPGLLARVRARLFPPAREPKAHDYRNQGWGHTAGFWKTDDEGLTGTMTGFGCGIEEGDFIIKSHAEGWCSYRVDSIRYESDPPDMWWAEVKWTPGVFTVVEGEIVRCEKN